MSTADRIKKQINDVWVDLYEEVPLIFIEKTDKIIDDGITELEAEVGKLKAEIRSISLIREMANANIGDCLPSKEELEEIEKNEIYQEKNKS